MNKGIVVAGSLILDRHYAVNSYPEEGRLAQIQNEHEDIGGIGNLIIDLAKLDSGLKVQVSAVLGTGSVGRSILRMLGEFPNIDTEGIELHGHSPMTLVVDAADTHQRTFFYSPGACDEYSEDCIEWGKMHADIFQLEYLLLMKKVDADDPAYGTHAARILAEAKRRGMKTSIDMVSEKSRRVEHIVRAALKYTDYCTINELEAQEVAGIALEDNGKILKEYRRPVLGKLASFGVAEWVIIHASDCSFGLDCRTGKGFAVPSLELPDGFIKGKTGAGDAYCSGVLYAVYTGRTILDAMKLGTACASCSLAEVNGTDGMRPYEDVIKMYNRYKGKMEYEEI